MADEPENMVLQLLRQMREHIDTRFDAVDTRLDAVDARFDAVDTKLAEMQIQIDSLEAKAGSTQAVIQATGATADRRHLELIDLIRQSNRRLDALEQD